MLMLPLMITRVCGGSDDPEDLDWGLPLAAGDEEGSRVLRLKLGPG